MAFFNVKNFEIKKKKMNKSCLQQKITHTVKKICIPIKKKKNSTHTHKERISVVGTQPRECGISEIKSRREREINSVQGFK